MNCGAIFHAYRKRMLFCSRKCAHVIRPPRLNPDRELVKARGKMAAFCCSAIERCIHKKSSRVYTMLGYNADQLRMHIESLFMDEMSWSNYGHQGWHIDHKKPISSFPLNTPVSVINALTNLQPMWAIDNFKKGSKII